MKLYTQEQMITAALNGRTSSIKIETIVDSIEPIEIDNEDKANTILLETVTRLIAGEIARCGGCTDTQLIYFFKLANKIIQAIDTKTLPNG